MRSIFRLLSSWHAVHQKGGSAPPPPNTHTHSIIHYYTPLPLNLASKLHMTKPSSPQIPQQASKQKQETFAYIVILSRVVKILFAVMSYLDFGHSFPFVSPNTQRTDK